jgi:hypothetical protein
MAQLPPLPSVAESIEYLPPIIAISARFVSVGTFR